MIFNMSIMVLQLMLLKNVSVNMLLAFHAKTHVIPLLHYDHESHESPRIDNFLDSWLNRYQFVKFMYVFLCLQRQCQRVLSPCIYEDNVNEATV